LVKPYLWCYLRLVEDNQCSISENSPLSCHFTTREEELIKIGVVSFERLVTLLYQGVEGKLGDVVLTEIESISAEVFTHYAWHLEVVNSPAELPKICLHMNRIRAGSTCSKQEKLDPPIWQTGLSGFINFDDSQGCHWHSMMELLLWPSDI
jgi:hypothetical protein